MKKYAKYIKKAKDLGAKYARVIPARSIVTGEWVRLKCKFGCGGYGRGLTCPPHSPTPAQTRQMLKDYKDILLIHGDDHTDISRTVVALEKQIFLDGYHKAWAIGAGPCRLCKKCAETCQHPDKARPAMEACGIDVFSTVRAHGLPIEVLKDSSCAGNYYGLVLLQ